MHKKITAILLLTVLICSLFSGMSILAAEEGEIGEFVRNGGFEEITASGPPVGWTFKGGVFGEEFSIDKKEKNSGENALHCYSENLSLSAYGYQAFRGLVVGEEYEMKFSVKAKRAEKYAIKLEFGNMDADGVTEKLGEDQAIGKTYREFSANRWETQNITFKAPGNSVTLYIRFYGGELWYDDVSIIGKKVEIEDPNEVKDEVKTAMNIKEPLPGAVNLIENGSFEEKNEIGAPKNWGCTGNTWDGSGAVSVITEGAFDGETAIRLSAADSSNPYVTYSLYGLKPGAEYQMRAWLYQVSTGNIGGKSKIEFYSDAEPGEKGTNMGEYTGDNFAPAEPGWKQVATTFIVPAGCDRVAIYLRVAGPGENVWDKVECFQTGEPALLTYETDNVFYYSDWYEGTATVAVNPLVGKTTLENSVVSFALKDEAGNVLDSAENVPIVTEAKFTFKVATLKEKQKPYTVEYKCTDAAGTVLGEGIETIYRYDRPTLIDENGVSLHPETGEKFLPVVGYHVRPQDYEYCKQAGVNLIQLNMGQSNTKEAMYKQLDELHEHGLFALVFLYFNMKPAGNAANQKSTARIVEAIKDHPAVYAWLCMDEPLLNGVTYEDLAASYKIIRDIDPAHPVYLVEAQSHAEYYDEVGKYCDVLAIDPYPTPIGTGEKPMEDNILKNTLLAKEAVQYKKPVWVINQSMVKHTIAGYFNPTSNDILHMHYQALMAGAEGLGYYDVRDLYGYVVPEKTYEHMWDRQHWPGILYFNTNELDTAFRVFVTKEYTTVNGEQGEKIWWRTYLRDGELYAVMINRTAEEQMAEIPLQSLDGSVRVGAFSAESDEISGIGTVSGDGTLSAALAPAQCAIFKITPSEAVDFSGLTQSRFDDLYDYSWAKMQIDTLAEADIVNAAGLSRFEPGTKITRADFAYFLVRTLGLEASSAENFADVNPEAYYAKELATGKALGILNGVGDNKYNPDAEISRQDLMTICARGMRYAGKLGEGGLADDVSSFTDAGLIADYALEAIASMVREKIVLGNADGTINPLGHATRAEAAVIMYRILQK